MDIVNQIKSQNIFSKCNKCLDTPLDLNKLNSNLDSNQNEINIPKSDSKFLSCPNSNVIQSDLKNQNEENNKEPSELINNAKGSNDSSKSELVHQTTKDFQIKTKLNDEFSNKDNSKLNLHENSKQIIQKLKKDSICSDVNIEIKIKLAKILAEESQLIYEKRIIDLKEGKDKKKEYFINECNKRIRNIREGQNQIQRRTKTI